MTWARVPVRPSARRAVRIASLVAALLVGVGAAAAEKAPQGPAAPAVAYRAPVLPLHVVRAFTAPLTTYGPGHRGVDLAADAGTAVHAAAVGTVTFAGSVAGRGVVVVTHADGIRTEYEPLTVVAHRGDRVTMTSVLGTVSGPHRGCASCLHWGARRGDAYFDPLSLLSGLGPVRLVPWTG